MAADALQVGRHPTASGGSRAGYKAAWCARRRPVRLAAAEEGWVQPCCCGGRGRAAGSGRSEARPGGGLLGSGATDSGALCAVRGQSGPIAAVRAVRCLLRREVEHREAFVRQRRRLRCHVAADAPPQRADSSGLPEVRVSAIRHPQLAVRRSSSRPARRLRWHQAGGLGDRNHPSAAICRTCSLRTERCVRSIVPMAAGRDAGRVGTRAVCGDAHLSRRCASQAEMRSGLRCSGQRPAAGRGLQADCRRTADGRRQRGAPCGASGAAAAAQW